VALLTVSDLAITFDTPRGPQRAVDGVSFELGRGETLGLVGESGCGKSVTALSIMRLLESPPATYSAGSITLEEKNLVTLPEREMQHLRGKDLAMVFQEPMTSLNPVYTVGFQIAEAIRLHTKASKKEARTRSIEMLARVGVPAPERNVDTYPHELSGGLRQRVMIAMALSCNPKVLIADEPTTALDVTIQAQILELLLRLKTELGMAVLLITHDLSVVAEQCERIAVMYAGKIVEQGPAPEVFAHPRHPYTVGLLGSLPKPSAPGASPRNRKLPVIRGVVPALHELPSGCRFRDRCDFANDACADAEPKLESDPRAIEHRFACFHPVRSELHHG
jgi:peptide/nickel transport system ATP-binding protein